MEEQNMNKEEKMQEEKKPEMKASEPAPSSSSSATASDNKLPGPKWLFILLAIFIPGIGPMVNIIMGIIYMTKDNEEQKKFGKTLLIVGIVFGVVLPCICWIVYFFFIAGLGILGEGVSNVNYNYNYNYNSSYGY